MDYDASKMTSQVWAPLVQIWEQRIEACKRAKKRFNAVHEQCLAFYHGAAGFMWQQTHNQRYFDGALPSPKFKITLNKAFEFVSIYGPSLFWQYPHRKVMSHNAVELRPELFGDPNDPQVMQIFQQFQMSEQQKRQSQDFANVEMSAYLNWSQRECNLVDHCQMSITEALMSGMGLLWPETYTPPGSETPYTKLRYGSVKDFYIDPDCHDPEMESAGYIMRRHVHTTWQLERMFGLADGALRGKGNLKSAEQTVREETRDAPRREDMIEWYEVWSKIGVGPRTASDEEGMLDTLDDVLGDYTYLCIAPTVNYPLNAHPTRFFGEDAWTEDDVKAAFEWRAANYGHPFPCWMDNRWPVSVLKFNRIPGTPWPLAPLGPGLGYLITLNVLMSSYVDQAWENRKTILAYMKSAAEDLEEALNTDEPFCKVGLQDNLHKNINEIMQIMKRPESNRDLLQAIAMVSEAFDKNVGLNELLYGQSSRQVRVAADIRERSARSSIRPDKMAGDVAMWMSSASQLEMFLAALHVEGGDLVHLLGEYGAAFWNMHFDQMDTVAMLREMKATVEASDVRRPNKERDTANIQALQQYVLPVLTQYGQMTGNYDPFNGMLESIGDAIETDTTRFQIPGPTPEEQQLQQVQAQLSQMASQLNLQRTEAETQQKLAQAQKAMTDAQVAIHSAGMDGTESQQDQKLRHNEELHDQKLIHEQEKQTQQLLFSESDMQMKEAASGSDDTED